MKYAIELRCRLWVHMCACQQSTKKRVQQNVFAFCHRSMQPSYRHCCWEENPITNVTTLDRHVINCKTKASNHAAGKAECEVSRHWIAEWIASNPDKFYPEPKLAHVSSHPRLASCRKRIVKPAKGKENKAKNKQEHKQNVVVVFYTVANICLGLNKLESPIILIIDFCRCQNCENLVPFSNSPA